MKMYQLIEIAKRHAALSEHDYTQASDFEPHWWVIEAMAEAYEDGKSDDDAFDAAREDGYSAGYEDGYSAGYEEGRAEGEINSSTAYDEGYEEGYQRGLDEAG